MKRCLVHAVLFCASLCTLPLSAQAGDWGNVKQLSPGHQVKVALQDGRSYKGHIRSVDDNGILLESGQSVAKQDVKRVLAKTKSHRGKHALIGGAIGAAAGLGLGAGIDADCSKTAIFCTGNKGKAVLTPVFGVIGLGVGALLPAHGWQEVYRSH